ncbi:MAG TPA: hypothetical protein VIV66_22980 [Pyrinomonadaceae bacterium]
MKVIQQISKYFPLWLLSLHSVLWHPLADPPVVTMYAVLVKAVDTKSANINQEVTLRTVSDLLVNGKVVIPNGSTVVGHLAEFATKGSSSPNSILAIVIDEAIIQTGQKIQLQAIIAAVAVPSKEDLSSDPTYGMMHSNEPKMVASSPISSARSGDLAASSKVTSTATVATATINGAPDKGFMLNADSQGAIGFANLSLSWRLTSPPPATVFSSTQKNLRLEAGTQVMLRMAPPQSAR